MAAVRRAAYRCACKTRPSSPSPHTPTLPPPHNITPQALTFEAFRDLIRLTARGLTDRDGIAHAQAEHIERRAHLQVALHAANQAAYGIKPGGGGGGGPSAALPAGTGQYGAVGFTYGGAGSSAGGGGVTGLGDDSDSSDEGSDSEDEGAPATEAEAAQEVEDGRVDEIAYGYGLRDFSYRLHKVLEQEGDDEVRMRARPR